MTTSAMAALIRVSQVVSNRQKADLPCLSSCTDDWTPHWAYVRDGTGEKAAKAIAKCYKKAKKANKVYSS